MKNECNQDLEKELNELNEYSQSRMRGVKSEYVSGLDLLTRQINQTTKQTNKKQNDND